MRYPICPHCGYEYDDDDIWSIWSDMPWGNDGDESIVECPKCKEKSGCRVIYSPSWEFYDPETEDVLEYKEGK